MFLLSKLNHFTNNNNNNIAHTSQINWDSCSLTGLTSLQISCQRVDKFICIGPYLSNDNYVHLSINPWAFSNLFLTNLVDTLQLDLNINTQQINALSLAGMDGLINLLAHTSQINWDSCSLTGLTSLREVTLNCKAIFHEYLTFNSLISVIRFVDCIGEPLQFYCIKCIQDPNVHVIRIRPGLPLRQHVVKFTQLSSLSSTLINNKTNDSDTHLSPNHHLPLDSCTYGVCSDEMLCRNNLPLKQAQDRIGQPEKPIIEIVSGKQNILPTTNSIELFTFSTSSVLKTLMTTTTPSVVAQSTNTTPLYDIVVLTKFGNSIMITINYQRKSRHKMKLTRSNVLLRNHNNGAHSKSNGRIGQHDSLIIMEDGNRIELPDIVSCK
ncbi:hypothetical protein MN116_002623 [Schistosoma mekongi]|uniref:Uncharacterized protein n=1 Tax=Schistosoma mekongi TaxID=38744 RepID=A0AAE1ZH79_SCHME|nr:hypothetical protein MN116_002623 [Schistosoma mekongi]